MILERDGELRTLSGFVDDLTVAGGRVALVRGEAGIGKSTLVERFVAEESARAHVLVGACDDLLTPQPFGPVWDVARREPTVADPLSHGDTRAVMEALLALLSRPARPTVLVIEDTQWADEATLDTIRFLGRRIGRANGLVLLTYRDGEVDLDHPLRQVIGDLPPQRVERLLLRPLSATAVATMIGDRPFAVDEILSLTGGNPLFVAEVVGSGTAAVPGSVRDAVLARVAKLPDGARQLLRLVSVVPGGATRHLVEALVGPTAEAVQAASPRGLLVVDADDLFFRHELQRRAVESSLTPAERRELNRMVLDRLGDRAEPSRLVHHAREAGDVEALVRHAPRAARAAVEIESHREAAAHFQALGPHLDRLPPSERADVLEEWAGSEVMLGSGRPAELVTEAIAIRRTLDDDVALARTLTLAVTVYERTAMPAEAEACAVEAVGILEPDGPSRALARALTQQAWLLFMAGSDDRRAVGLAERARRMAEAEGDELTTVRAMMWAGAIAYNAGDHEAFAVVEEAQRRAARAGFRQEETIALINLAGMCGDVRDVARASDLARRARETAARHEQGSLQAYAQAMYAEILLWQGSWEEAETTATDALQGGPHPANIGWRILGLLQARRGRAEAGSILERARSHAEQSGELQQLDPMASVLAEYTWLVGDDDADRRAFILATAEHARASGPPWPSGALVLWLWKLDLLDDVPAHTPECYRAIIDGRWELAAEFWRSRGVPYEEGVALLHGDTEARLRAIELFEGLGAGATAARARRELRAVGVRVPRGRSATTRAHLAGLTSRQAEVLALLADGLSNAEIADRLFISPRTVENHVTAVLMKLDVADRRAAVSVARDRGFVAS